MDNIIDEYLRRYLRLIRVAEGESLANVARIEKVNEKISEMFNSVFSQSKITKANLNALRVNIHNAISYVYDKELVGKLSKDVDDLIQLEFEWNKGLFKKIGFGDKVLNANQAAVVKAALNKPYQGKTFKNWFEGEGALHFDKVNRIIQAGITSGANNEKIIKAISDISRLPKSHVATLTRSAIMSSMNDVKSEFFDVNSNLIDGKLWTSVLDARTTPFICGPRDHKKYSSHNEPIGHNLPWGNGPGRMHFNCRSTWVPLIQGFSYADAPRASVTAGKNYHVGDKYTRSGKVRKNTQYNRENDILKVEQVTNRTRYEGWLRRQPTDYVADAFGGSMEIAKRFKSGESLSNLYSSIYGEPITIAGL